VFLLSRSLTTPFTCCSPQYQSDGALDACVKPWQLVTGQPITGADTTYLSMAIYLLVSEAFGFDVLLLQLVTALLMACSMAVAFLGLDRAIGRGGALATCGLLAVSLPFITHGSLPTNTASSLWGVSAALYLLTLPATGPRIVLLALAGTLSLLAYAAGIVTLAPLLGLHVLLFRDAWPARRFLLLAAGGALGGAVVAALRHALRGGSDLMHWGIDTLSLPSGSSYLESLRVVLGDVFVSGQSWYAGSYGHPYLSWPVIVLLGVAAAALLASRVAPRAMRDRVELPPDRARWLLLFLLAFAAAAAFAAVNTREPGVRRAFPAVVFLFAVAGTAPFLFRQHVVKAALVVLLMFAFAQETTRSVDVVHSHWAEERVDAATVLSRLLREVLADEMHPVAVFIDVSELGGYSDWAFCGVHFDAELQSRMNAFYAVRRGEAGFEFLREGNPQWREDVAQWRGPAIVLASSQSVADALRPYFRDRYLVKVRLFSTRILETDPRSP
jgi:hypothetical protein